MHRKKKGAVLLGISSSCASGGWQGENKNIKPNLWFSPRKSAFPCTLSQLAHWTFWAERLFREQKQHSSFRSSLHSQVTCRALVLVTLRGELAFLPWVWACETSAQPGWWAVPSQAEGMCGSWRLYRTQNKQAERYICKVWPRVSLVTPIRLMGTNLDFKSMEKKLRSNAILEAWEQNIVWVPGKHSLSRRYSLCWPGLGTFG